MPSLEDFKQTVNPNALSIDSLEGIIVICLIIFAIYAIGKRMLKAVCWCMGALILIELLYGLSLTGFNDIIPISNIIKYDLMVSVAQVFSGTVICDWLLSLSAWIHMITYKAGEVLTQIIGKLHQ